MATGLKPKWYRTPIDLTSTAIVFAVAGGALFGGLGSIFGFAVGVTSAISSIPLSARNPKAREVTAKALTLAGFASPVPLLLVCVLLLVLHHGG